VKSALGPDAVILTTREVGRSRLWGLGRRPSVEIVAATDIRIREMDTRASRRVPPPPPRARPSGASPAAGRAAPSQARPAPEAVSAIPSSTTDVRLTQLERHLSDMRAALEQVAMGSRAVLADGGPAVPLELTAAYRELLDAEVRRELVLQLIDGVAAEPHGEGTPEARVRAAIAERIRTAGPIALAPGETRIAALIGPTGVGKTTTIAKLAADFTFMGDKHVGLLTVDTYRVAAVEQLRTFADIMTVPVLVASTAEEAKECLGKFSPKPDLVLVDTAGRSQRNLDQVSALRELLEAVEPNEIHLVLSATTKSGDLSDIVRRFGRLGANRLIFTKLDETTTCGPILNTVVECGLPISYVTSGQMVPEDFEVAAAGALARLILPGSDRHA